MKDRRSQLKSRVLSEALGWYHREPFSLDEWMATPGAMAAALKRLDEACADLIAERQRIKALKREPQHCLTKEK